MQIFFLQCFNRKGAVLLHIDMFTHTCSYSAEEYLLVNQEKIKFENCKNSKIHRIANQFEISIEKIIFSSKLGCVGCDGFENLQHNPLSATTSNHLGALEAPVYS